MKIHALIAGLVAFLMAAVPAVAQDGYRISPGDTLNVEVLEDPGLNRSTIVLPDGNISFPFAGTVSASGKTIGQIEASITEAIASNFANRPNVFVSVVPGERKPARAAAGPARIDVYFLGEVAAPGLKELARGTTFLQALASGGGLSKFAATKRIQLRRTDPRTGQQTLRVINYKAFADGAGVGKDFRLQDGDVILVPERRLFE